MLRYATLLLLARHAPGLKDSAIAGRPQPAASSAAHSPAGSVGQTSEETYPGFSLEDGVRRSRSSDPDGCSHRNHRQVQPWRMRFRLTANCRVLPATHYVSHRSKSPLLAQTQRHAAAWSSPLHNQSTCTQRSVAVPSSNLPSAGVDIRTVLPLVRSLIVVLLHCPYGCRASCTARQPHRSRASRSSRARICGKHLI
jgi:hypothetical protein